MARVLVKRHIAKAITWRIVGTIDTVILSWIVVGSIESGFSIGLSELLTKTLLYIVHERIWYRFKILKDRSKLRHGLKTITWRFIGTIDTVVLAWLITGRPDYGIYIGGFELISKMALYYIHERVWYRSKFGVDENIVND